MRPEFKERVDVFAGDLHIGCLAKADVTSEILEICARGPAVIKMKLVPLCLSWSQMTSNYVNFIIE